MKIKTLKPNQVLLSLEKPWFREYLQSIFEKEDDSIKINEYHDVGLIIYANTIHTQLLKLRTYTDYTIIISLPDCKYSNLDTRFYYVDKAANRRINLFIQAHFNLSFAEFMYYNRNKTELTKNELVALFHKEKLLSTESISEETLLKKDFRERQKMRL